MLRNNACDFFPRLSSYTFEDGSHYEGTWQNFMPHGKGTYKFINGTVYTVSFLSVYASADVFSPLYRVNFCVSRCMECCLDVCNVTAAFVASFSFSFVFSSSSSFFFLFLGNITGVL